MAGRRALGPAYSYDSDYDEYFDDDDDSYDCSPPHGFWHRLVDPYDVFGGYENWGQSEEHRRREFAGNAIDRLRYILMPGVLDDSKYVTEFSPFLKSLAGIKRGKGLFMHEYLSFECIDPSAPEALSLQAVIATFAAVKLHPTSQPQAVHGPILITLKAMGSLQKTGLRRTQIPEACPLYEVERISPTDLIDMVWKESGKQEQPNAASSEKSIQAPLDLMMFLMHSGALSVSFARPGDEAVLHSVLEQFRATDHNLFWYQNMAVDPTSRLWRRAGDTLELELYVRVRNMSGYVSSQARRLWPTIFADLPQYATAMAAKVPTPDCESWTRVVVNLCRPC
jgi:hypothetical protein